MPMRMNWELIGGLVALAGAVLFAILVLEWVKRWVRQSKESGKGDELGHFRRLMDEGLLTQDEFARVQSAVERRGRKPAPVSEGAPPREEGIFDASARQGVRAVNEAKDPTPPLPPASVEEPSGDGSQAAAQPAPRENGGSAAS